MAPGKGSKTIAPGDQGPSGRDLVKELAEEFGTPLYLYDREIMSENVSRLRESIEHRPLRLHFAAMSNGNIALMREFRDMGIGVHCSSPVEIRLAQEAGFESSSIVVTGCGFTSEEMRPMARAGVVVNIDSLGQLSKALDAGIQRLGLRINPPIPDGCQTTTLAIGPLARLGLAHDEIGQAISLAVGQDAEVIGVQMYYGTNVSDGRGLLGCIQSLIEVAAVCPALEYVDVGGGFSIPYSDNEAPFPWATFGHEVSALLSTEQRRRGTDIELKLEPGRALVAQAGSLLARVVDVKERQGRTFVTTDASLSVFPRPYIYGSEHRVDIISLGADAPVTHHIFICGNTVASGDFLASDRTLPRPSEGDLVANRDVGAYGYSMSSRFCGRLRPPEVLLKGGQAVLVRRRETIDDVLATQISPVTIPT